MIDWWVCAQIWYDFIVFSCTLLKYLNENWWKICSCPCDTLFVFKIVIVIIVIVLSFVYPTLYIVHCSLLNIQYMRIFKQMASESVHWCCVVALRLAQSISCTYNIPVGERDVTNILHGIEFRQSASLEHPMQYRMAGR